MFVGIFQLALRFLRLSFLINLLSHSVISGFTTSVAVIYILQQVRLMFYCVLFVWQQNLH